MHHHNDPADIPGRDRGILTPTDRDYLLNPSGVEDAQSRNIRSKARRRIYDSILDFTILFNRLPERDLNQIFGEFSADEQEARSHLSRSITDAFSFLYYADPSSFDSRLERAIRHAKIRTGVIGDVTVEIEVETTDTLADVRERVDETGVIYSDEFELLDFHDAIPENTRRLPGYRRDRLGIPEDVTDPIEAIRSVYLSHSPPGAPDDLDERPEDVQRALRATYDYVQQLDSDHEGDGDLTEDTAKERVTERVYPLYPLGYENATKWWNLMHGVLLSIEGALPWTPTPESDEQDDEHTAEESFGLVDPDAEDLLSSALKRAAESSESAKETDDNDS